MNRETISDIFEKAVDSGGYEFSIDAIAEEFYRLLDIELEKYNKDFKKCTLCGEGEYKNGKCSNAFCVNHFEEQMI